MHPMSRATPKPVEVSLSLLWSPSYPTLPTGFDCDSLSGHSGGGIPATKRWREVGPFQGQGAVQWDKSAASSAVPKPMEPKALRFSREVLSEKHGKAPQLMGSL